MKVVVCTPTKNRRWAWKFSKYCMDGQILKPDLWIVLDNSTCPADDWAVSKDCSYVEYHRVYEQKPIGELRNMCLDLALKTDADYIVFWDDDDYYPPTRISSGVAALEKNPTGDISGSSKMFLLQTRENVLMTTGPFHDKHATAATWTIRRSYAEKHRFNPEKARGEELDFTEKWSANMIQVPAEEMIVVMGHSKNTVDKSVLLKTPKVFLAETVNADNGKMAFRVRWPVRWDIWKSTFSDAECVRPQECTPLEASQKVIVPILHTEDIGVSAEHHA
jgi:glycosyltransferase involved in cell wall biosynthesis